MRCVIMVFVDQARSDTLYCFDFLELLETGVREQWAAYAKERSQVPKKWLRDETKHRP